MVCPRKRVRSRDCVAAARDLCVPSLRGDAEQPGSQLVGERVLRRLKAALDTLPGPHLRGPSVGCSSRRRGGVLRGSEGARPPASLRRGRTECGHGGYAGFPALAASNKAVADVSSLPRISGVQQGRRRRVLGPLSAAADVVAEQPRKRSGKSVRRASRSAADGGMDGESVPRWPMGEHDRDIRLNLAAPTDSAPDFRFEIR